MSYEYQIKGDYIDGKYIQNKRPDRTIEKVSPANIKHKLWSCDIYYEHLESAVDSAEKAFRPWRTLSLEQRVEYLNRYKEAVITKQDEIATAIALETGKPLWESKTEAAALVAKVDVTISESLPRIENKRFANIMANTNGQITYRPIGTSVIIGPFNFPCHLANGQILNSLIAGNPVIFKPSEKTCYSAQLMMDCFHEAGFPPGVINLLQGDGEMASRLTKEKSVKIIHFTGSKEVGIKILKNTYKDLNKLVALELGGKNTTIIHEDTSMDYALSELIKSCFLTAGQRCTSTSIVAIHRKVHEEMLARFHELSKRIIIDHPIEHEREPFMGPLIDKQSVDTYLLFMGMAKREGAEEIMRGKFLEKKFQGNYVTPSIHLINKVNPKSLFLQSEIFGPNCSFIPYDEIEEAIEIANMTEYGLAGAVFTQDEAIFDKCRYELDVGILNHNRSTVGANSKLPFGGVKNSGNYRPAAVTTIDHCVFQQANLEVYQEDAVNLDAIKGISPHAIN